MHHQLRLRVLLPSKKTGDTLGRVGDFPSEIPALTPFQLRIIMDGKEIV